ncbi:phage antirepressor KilAC domain-containing protein [Halopseudomonas bauzanensis]|uniref:phage antirepressor KilAC domain-containing protein n=1 Tax=Halopseudomonas bauzanensis TaxID=653930 RepID=UPI00352467FD
MNIELMLSNTSPLTMSSREIAHLTDKQHKHVIRDIRTMLAELEEDGPILGHHETKDARGYTAAYHLNRELTETLITGYSIPLRHRVIRRLHELEEQPAAIPSTLPEALRLAADLAEQNTSLRLVMQEQAPKVQALQRIAQARGTLCLTDAAKHLGVQRKLLLAWMRENRWIYRREGAAHWLGYQPRLQAGLLEHRVTVLGTEDDGAQRLASQVRVTPKGLTVLAQKMGGAN